MSQPPLDGIRVVDFCWAWAGPYGTLQMAHLGADVIRIESAKRLCPSRLIPPWPDNESGVNRAGYFNQYNQGKRSLTLDLKAPEAIDIAKTLVSKSDIVMNNFASGVMEKLGVGYDVLRRIKSDIIMVSLPGYGTSGPEKDFVSYGPPQVAQSGLSALTGYVGGPPMMAGFSYGDPNGGIHATFAVMAALLHREKTGQGQYIDLSQWEAAIMLLPEAVMDYSMNGTQPERMGNRDPHMAPHGVFRSKGDDRWVSLSVRDEAEWQRLCEVMGQPELSSDARFASLAARKENEAALEEIVTAWTQACTADEATQALQNAGIPAYPSLDAIDMIDNPHVGARDYFVELEHPEVGTRRHMGIPWTMSRTPCEIRRPAPCLGQDTDAVLTDIVGLSQDEIAALRERDVLT
ncbi:MAG: CoA transferase [Desulfurellaceae bacterium]|nr:CoA transferase [Desulfurellaceae bacterium]